MTAYDFAITCMNIAQNFKTIYVMGCLGRPMTPGYKEQMYNHHEYNRRANKWKHIKAAESDRFGFDCVCLIKSVIWGWDGNLEDGGISYGSAGLPDIGTETIMSSTYCNDISTDMSNVQTGEILWCPGHVGVYLGCDRVAECTPAWRNCVQISTLRQTVSGYGKQKWRKHGKLKVLTYDGRQITRVPGIVCKSDASNLSSQDSGTVHASSASSTSSSSSVFVPRAQDSCVPDSLDPNWLHVSRGGKNSCLLRYHDTVLPNCVGYAWGRFMEILGRKPSLSTGNAEMWWPNTSDGYERGSSPRLGAVACWAKGAVGNNADGAGHVAIVEAINSDGSMIVSQSGYSRTWERRFWTETLHKAGNNWVGSRSGHWLNKYSFQGFIYNPITAAQKYIGSANIYKDKLSYFVEAAKSACTKSTPSSWLQSVKTKLDPITSNRWGGLSDQSLKFVLGCASEVDGLLGTVIPGATSRSGLVDTGVTENMGAWISGPANEVSCTPHPGDIIYARTSSVGHTGARDSDRIGIVVTIMSGKRFEYVYMSNGTCSSAELSFDSNLIAGYYRPKWRLVGANILNQVGISLTLSVYNEISGRDDAIIREIGYLNSRLEPSISSSAMRLSVINYTSGINALFLAWGGGASSSSSLASPTYSTPPEVSPDLLVDGLGTVERAIVSQLIGYGFNAAAVLGILANIKHESYPSFNVASKGDYRNGRPTSFGLCQWHNERGDAMKSYCLAHGGHWETNVNGQIAYLYYEITETYERRVMPYLEKAPNTVQGCMDAAEAWCRIFERPANPNKDSQTRRSSAEKYWKSCAIQLGAKI